MIVPTKLSGVFTKAKFVELHCALTLAVDPVLFGTLEQRRFQRKYAFETWNRSNDERRVNLFATMVSELVKADPKNAFFTKRRFIQVAIALGNEITQNFAVSIPVSRRVRNNFGQLWDQTDSSSTYSFFLLQYGRKILGKITVNDLVNMVYY